jgi:hypothetical protein
VTIAFSFSSRGPRKHQHPTSPGHDLAVLGQQLAQPRDRRGGALRHRGGAVAVPTFQRGAYVSRLVMRDGQLQHRGHSPVCRHRQSPRHSLRERALDRPGASRRSRPPRRAQQPSQAIVRRQARARSRSDARPAKPCLRLHFVAHQRPRIPPPDWSRQTDIDADPAMWDGRHDAKASTHRRPPCEHRRDDARVGPAGLTRRTPPGCSGVKTPDAKLVVASNRDASSGLRFS